MILLSLLVLKHLIVDFPLQGPYMYKNKGTYGHLGGWTHAFMHGIFTYIILLFFTNMNIAMLFGVADMLIHYHIDWAKVNICKFFNWKMDTHEQYWWMLGLDQYLHTMTYIAIVSLI